MEILTDLVKKMSISGDLDREALVADKVSDQFCAVESLKQLDNEAFVKGRSSVTRTQSEGDLNLNDKMDWSMREEIVKRKKKHTTRWLEYQLFQLEGKKSRLYRRLIRKSNEFNDLLCSARNVERVKEQMLQVDDLFKMVQRCTKSIMLSYQLNRKPKMRTGLMRLMPACCSSNKRSMVGSEMLSGKGMLPWKQSQKEQVCLEVCHQRGQVDIQARHHQAQDHQRLIKH